MPVYRAMPRSAREPAARHSVACAAAILHVSVAFSTACPGSLALNSVSFGVGEDPSRDNNFFCSNSYGSCDLTKLCHDGGSTERYPQTGLLKNTPPEAWCGFEDAGALTTRLVWCAWPPGHRRRFPHAHSRPLAPARAHLLIFPF